MRIWEKNSGKSRSLESNQTSNQARATKEMKIVDLGFLESVHES